LAIKIIAYWVLFSVLWVLLYRWINTPITYLMLKRKITALIEDKPVTTLKYTWVDIDQMSDYLPLAMVCAEDQRFFQHHGFDWEGMKKAYENNKKGKKLKGGSTISQQTVKNVFLWDGRSYVRKAFEAYFTFLMEFLWPKKRILEVYLNVAETGVLTFGVEEGAKRYFYKSANKLTPSEAALIAVTLPNPKKYDPKNPHRMFWEEKSGY
jgi:monofunctional glycosyltransferase